jgi:hypothetical protein
MPEPLFILNPPRSYSSIVCTMIGQHPECYGLPELNLFIGDDLGAVWNGFAVIMRGFGRDGMLRTLAQLHEGTQNVDTITRAHEWVIQHSRWSIRQVFDHLQELVGPRILVEKSPSIVSSKEFIERLLRHFPDARLLHLLRHPRSTAESVLSLREAYVHLKLLVERLPGLDPERTWRFSHQLVVAATEWLPPGQCMRLKGEALLAALDLYLAQLCEWLGIRRDAEALDAMKHPERSPYASPGPRGAPRGNDPNFLENPHLDFDRLARIKEPSLDEELGWRPGEFFSPPTVKLARELGYA